MGKVKMQNKSYVLEMLKTLIIALILSLVLVLIAAFLINALSIKTSILPIINQIIKGICILAACLISMRLPDNGWLRGLVLGILYTLLTFFVFSLLDGGSFKFGISLLTDVALGMVMGLISGIISVNLRNH